MVDVIGTIVTAGLMVLAVSVVTTYMDVTRATRLVLSACLGLWIGLCAAAASAGLIATTKPFPLIGPFVAAPLLAAALAAAVPAARAAMLSIPMPVMIAINAGRVFAVLFLVLMAQGRLAGPFPYFAAGGDIITGLLALPIARRAATAGMISPVSIAAWNLFGTADLVLAITLGVISADGSPLQIIHAPPGSQAMQQVPWSFVPTVLVPFWLVLHAIIWAQLRREPAPAQRGTLGELRPGR